MGRIAQLLARKANEYLLDAPLYARRPLKISGHAVDLGAAIPEHCFTSARKRKTLWMSRLATHEQRKSQPTPPPAPTTSPATVQPQVTSVVVPVRGSNFTPPAGNRKQR